MATDNFFVNDKMTNIFRHINFTNTAVHLLCSNLKRDLAADVYSLAHTCDDSTVCVFDHFF